MISCRLILDCAGLAGVRPVAAHLLPVFLVGLVEFEPLASGAAIDILLRVVSQFEICSLGQTVSQVRIQHVEQ